MTSPKVRIVVLRRRIQGLEAETQRATDMIKAGTLPPSVGEKILTALDRQLNEMRAELQGLQAQSTERKGEP